MTLLLLAGILAAGLPNRVDAQYPGWQHHGSIYILTTPEGAELPASAAVKGFPLLVRLHRDGFPFAEAEAGGADIRFSAGGKPLAYEIEEWDPEAGAASVWVKIPAIRGNERQEIKIHWGKSGAPSASDGKAVFNAANGHIGVWHLGSELRDVARNLESGDKGTTEAEGVIGGARHFPGKKGVFCGKEIQVLPSGGASHSTQAWFRPESSNGRIVAWGNEKRQGKVTMLYQSPPRVRMDCYFSSADVRAEIPGGGKGWTHAVHTYEDGQAILWQFYARDDSGQGTLHGKGTLEENAAEVFLRVFANDKKFAEESAEPGKDGSYAFAIKLNAALIKYRIEFGTRTGGKETVLHRAGDIVCGDAYLIQGQSNALATDTREESPRVTNEWIRSYGQPRFFKEGERENLWCKPVWKANNKEKKEYLAELGWWGMELGKQLVESQKVPVFILNGAKGGTRIDQHQRNDEEATDLETIYGRMLWRMREARLTHGIRGVIWHQGESDQGAAGPDGGYGWETYQRYFVDMSADWKRDFPNVSQYYLYQIWPNACSMGGGNGDMMREVQRTLPRLYSNMEVLSTLGIKPPGGCHFPLTGWSKFARMVQPLIERDFYGRKLTSPPTPPNLMQASYTSDARESIALEFDQPVVWDDLLASQFYLDDVDGAVVRGDLTGNVLTLTLNKPGAFERITYLKEMSWKQENILMGKNGLAALTFCNVPIIDQKGIIRYSGFHIAPKEAAKLIEELKALE